LLALNFLRLIAFSAHLLMKLFTFSPLLDIPLFVNSPSKIALLNGGETERAHHCFRHYPRDRKGFLSFGNLHFLIFGSKNCYIRESDNQRIGGGYEDRGTSESKRRRREDRYSGKLRRGFG